MAAEFCLRSISIHARKVILHAVNLQHGTYFFTSPPKELVLRIFITLKIHRPRPGLNPRTLGPVASTLINSAPSATHTRVFHLRWTWSRSGCDCKLDTEAVCPEPFAISSDEDRLAAGVTKLQSRRLSWAQRKQLIKVREGGGEK
jgi:hypothetical protein